MARKIEAYECATGKLIPCDWSPEAGWLKRNTPITFRTARSVEAGKVVRPAPMALTAGGFDEWYEIAFDQGGGLTLHRSAIDVSASSGNS